MGGHISLNVILSPISIEERVEDLNQVFWLLEIILHSYKVMDTGS